MSNSESCLTMLKRGLVDESDQDSIYAVKKNIVENLDELVQHLHRAFATDIVDIDYVQNLMSAYRSNPHDWKKYAKFDRYRYTRNLVDEGNGRFNLIVLCWGEGHGSAIHDHANSHCFMKILQGELCETRYTWPEDDSIEKEEMRDEEEAENNERMRSEEHSEKLKETKRSIFHLNDVCYINDSLGLHRIENPSTVNPAVSLHLYSPPFDTCSVFNKHTGQRLPSRVTFWSKFGEPRNREIQESRLPEDN